MPLQKQVNIYPAEGIPGDQATNSQAIYTVHNPLCSVNLPVGGFVFPVIEDGEPDYTMATNVAGDADKVMGFVERNPVYVNFDVLSEGTLTVPAGSALTVAVKGDYWAVSSTDATVGQAVLASTEDGSVSTGTADATHIDTGWVVRKGGAAGEPIIISNWGVQAPKTAA